MKKIRFSRLNQAVKTFLTQLKRGEGILIEDEAGVTRYEVGQITQTTQQERNRAWQEIEALQEKAGTNLKKKNISEEDITAELLKSD